METNWGKDRARRPVQGKTLDLRDLGDSDLHEMVSAVGGAVAALGVNDFLESFAAAVDWQEIHRAGVVDLTITPDIVRDALSLFRLTDTATSRRQPLEWWQRLAAAVQHVHSAIAHEQARRAGEDRM